MCYDYLSIIYANDCARSVRLANRRRSALFRTRGSSVLPSGLLCSAQRLALFCTMLLSSIKLNPAHPCLAFSCLPCLFLPSSPFLASLFFLSSSLFSFPFPFFSFLFSLKSFCPLLLLPIFFCLIFAKTEETMFAYGRRDAKAKADVRRTKDRLHESALGWP